uniref:Uncharacterized protein n=1 Tax=Arundo donax TaxID=35708 RepID=A0A0A9CNU0_ARUDO
MCLFVIYRIGNVVSNWV